MDADLVLQVGGLKAATSTGASALNVTTVDGDAVWPNQADWMPSSSGFEFNNAVLGASGFFAAVPGYPSKATGTVDLYLGHNSSSKKCKSFSCSDGPSGYDKVQLSVDKTDYFYHKSVLIDCNSDGLLDVMAARVNVPTDGSPPTSELVCMLQPSPAAAAAAQLKDVPAPSAGSAVEGAWPEVVLYTNGPDVSFVLVDLDGDGASQVVASEYFVNQRLALYSCDSSGNQWATCAGGANVTLVVIDDSEGGMFNVEWVDLNGDGVLDILASSQGDHGSGRVLAYLQPSPSLAGAWRTEPWPKYVLADGYKPTMAIIPGRGSPGTATPFAPPPSTAADAAADGAVRPWIAVSADDGGWVDVLVPPSTDNSDPDQEWVYAKSRVLNSTGTVGTVACGDVDGDGVAELFVPLYTEGRLAMYKLEGYNNTSIDA